jgi:acyl carrier protein
MSEIEIKILKIMSIILKTDPNLLNEDSNMDNLSQWDSLRHMNLILALEDEFNISYPEEEVGSLTSFKLLRISTLELLNREN